MRRSEFFVREWWDDVRYENGAVRIRHPRWDKEQVISILALWRVEDYSPQGITIHRHSLSCGCESKAWDAAVTETRNTLFFIYEAMEEEKFLEEILRDRKSNGICEIHDQTPIGRLIERQASIVYERGRFLKKSVTHDQLSKILDIS